MKKTALEQVEEAVSLLRQQTAATWAMYAAGTVPLVCAVLFLVRDVATPYGADLCLRDSLLCGVAFIWAQFWKARFAGSLLASLGGNAESNEVWRCVYIQSVLQTLKLFVFPLAVVSIFPLPWVSSIFRAVNVEANRADASPRSALANAAKKATAQTGRNSVGLLICMLAGFIVLVNVAILIGMLPRLIQSFTGAENQWTRTSSMAAGFNFLSAICGIMWLVIDPLLGAFAVLGCFYFEARKDGCDLLVRLRRITAGIAIVLGLLLVPAPSRAGELTVHDLKQQVTQVSKGRDYRWLREQKVKPQHDWFGDRLVRDWDSVMDSVGSWFKSVTDWLDGIFKKEPAEPGRAGESKTKTPRMRWLLILGAGLFAVTAVFILVRQRRRKNRPLETSSGATSAAPESVQDVLATERRHEEWLAMARDFASRGELRLAIRAMYLANLSYLGTQELLAITKSKSNAIYERELRNRCRSADLCGAFIRSNREYERLWYGMHEPTNDLRDSFEQDVLAIRSHA